VQFSIITPSFRNSEWLKLCIPSVADQEVSHEHIVHDSCSDDGTLDWLPQDKRVTAIIEKDKGMYDAVNRGFKRSKGEILAYINCDEQYTPGALKAVWDFFQKNPDVEMVFADTIVVEADGSFRCFRKVQAPYKYYTWVSGNLCVLTSSIFFRRSVVDQKGLYFDTKYRDLGDQDWIMRCLGKNVKMATFRFFTSTFTETGANMNLQANARREKKEFFETAPAWARKLRPLFIAHHRLRRWMEGAYTHPPFSYSIYTKPSPTQRVTFQVDKPTGRWVR
jgi:glycosyltransferase involved in cell wall biosynthesis